MADIEEIKKKLEDHERRILYLENKNNSIQISDDKLDSKLSSLKDFLIEKSPSNDIDRTLAIGYFLEKKKNFESFTKKDIEDGYHESRNPLPPNISDKIQKNVDKETMMHAKAKKDGKDAWVITAKGERFVENKFQKMNK